MLFSLFLISTVFSAEKQKSVFPEQIAKIQLGDSFQKVTEKFSSRLQKIYTYNGEEFTYYGATGLFTINKYKFSCSFSFLNDLLIGIGFNTKINHDDFSEVNKYFFDFIQTSYGPPSNIEKENPQNKLESPYISYEWLLHEKKIILRLIQKSTINVSIDMDAMASSYEFKSDIESFDKSLGKQHPVDDEMKKLMRIIYGTPQKFPPGKK
jgi:hypothetical protein